MDLQKTEILSEHEQDGSDKFKEYLREDLALFVVLGSGDLADKLVELADGMAGDESDPTKVLWAKNSEVVRPSLLAGRFVPDPKYDSRLPNLESDLGFTVHREDYEGVSPRRVSDVIEPQDILDEVRVSKAWGKAGV